MLNDQSRATGIFRAADPVVDLSPIKIDSLSQEEACLAITCVSSKYYESFCAFSIRLQRCEKVKCSTIVSLSIQSSTMIQLARLSRINIIPFQISQFGTLVHVVLFLTAATRIFLRRTSRGVGNDAGRSVCEKRNCQNKAEMKLHFGLKDDEKNVSQNPNQSFHIKILLTLNFIVIKIGNLFYTTNCKLVL